jgi:F plasmid transfer operon, TraF, protein
MHLAEQITSMSKSIVTLLKTIMMLGMTLNLYLTSLPSIAISYGVYDSRSMGMGGTAGAISTPAQAVFYNPALLAFHNRDEDDGRDSRVSFPNLVVKYSDAVRPAADAANDNLDQELSRDISNFNTAQTAENAALAATAAQDLNDVLDDIANKNIDVDAFFGLSVTVPSMQEGGAFVLGTRLVGGGIANISDADSALVDDYVAALNQLAAGTPPATVAGQFPQLFNGTQLNDPTATLTSNADVSALAITEWGLALAKQWENLEHGIAVGITPKVMRVDAMSETADFNDNASVDNTGLSDSRQTHYRFNMDIGVAAIVKEHYRVSFSVKDAFERRFETQEITDPTTGTVTPSRVLVLGSRARLGLGYVNEKLTLGLDYDMAEAAPILNGTGTQELCIGAEYRLLNRFAIRAGYTQDQTSARDNLVSGGLGFYSKYIVIDLAYVTGGDYTGGGLQFGINF